MGGIMDWLMWVWSDPQLKAASISLAVTILIAVVKIFLAARPKIRWGIQNNNHLLVPVSNGPTMNVFIRSFTVSNSGSKVADDVEIVLNYKPYHLEYYPHLPITETLNVDGRCVQTIKRLNPKEHITFSMLSTNAQLPDITYVRCYGHRAKQVNMAPMQVFPVWWNLSVIAIFFVGLVSILYCIIYMIVR